MTKFPWKLKYMAKYILKAFFLTTFPSNQKKCPKIYAVTLVLPLKWEENKYFLPYAYCFIFKSNLLNPNLIEKNSYSILFFSEGTFSMSKVNFWMFGFIETKRLNIDSFTNENFNKFVIGVKFPGEKKKKFVVYKVLQIISDKNVPVPRATWKMWIRFAIILNRPWHNLRKIIRLRISTI